MNPNRDDKSAEIHGNTLCTDASPHQWLPGMQGCRPAQDMVPQPRESCPCGWKGVDAQMWGDDGDAKNARRCEEWRPCAAQPLRHTLCPHCRQLARCPHQQRPTLAVPQPPGLLSADGHRCTLCPSLAGRLRSRSLAPAHLRIRVPSHTVCRLHRCHPLPALQRRENARRHLSCLWGPPRRQRTWHVRGPASSISSPCLALVTARLPPASDAPTWSSHRHQSPEPADRAHPRPVRPAPHGQPDRLRRIRTPPLVGALTPGRGRPLREPGRRGDAARARARPPRAGPTARELQPAALSAATLTAGPCAAPRDRVPDCASGAPPR